MGAGQVLLKGAPLEGECEKKEEEEEEEDSLDFQRKSEKCTRNKIEEKELEEEKEEGQGTRPGGREINEIH